MNSIDEMAQPLTAFIRTVCPTGTVVRMVPIAGGASRETWAVDVQTADELMELVLRMDQASSMNPDALSRAAEFALLERVAAAGVQVPAPLLLEPTGDVLGRPFLLMARVAGESIGPKVLRRPDLADARAHLPAAMAAQLARIHATPVDGLELPAPAAGRSPAHSALDATAALIRDRGITSPALVFGLRWLARRAPACPAPGLVHGDFRIGNLLVSPAGLQAVIDWEFAHIGDFHEDLAWVCVRDWRFGNDAARVGGVGDLEPFLVAYEQASGTSVDRAAVRFWEILGNLRWAATCRVQALRHLSGADPSVEYASLGRRAAEMELELLNLIAEEERNV